MAAGVAIPRGMPVFEQQEANRVGYSGWDHTTESDDLEETSGIGGGDDSEWPKLDAEIDENTRLEFAKLCIRQEDLEIEAGR